MINLLNNQLFFLKLFISLAIKMFIYIYIYFFFFGGGGGHMLFESPFGPLIL